MQTVQVDKQAILDKYNQGNAEKKQELEMLFGKEFFKGESTERINSYLDACDDQNIKPMSIEDFANHPEGYRERAYAVHQLDVIAKSINGNYVPDFSDDTKKWFPVFTWNGSGFGFSGTYYDFSRTGTSCGSRLSFETEAKAKYFGTQFLPIHNIALTK